MRLRRSPLRSGNASGSSRPHQTVDDSVFLSRQSAVFAGRRFFAGAKRQTVLIGDKLYTFGLSSSCSSRAFLSERDGEIEREIGSAKVNYMVYDSCASRVYEPHVYISSFRHLTRFTIQFSRHLLNYQMTRLTNPSLLSIYTGDEVSLICLIIN